MPVRHDPRRERPGLTEAQKAAMESLAKRDKITSYEMGQLRAFTYFGDEADARRAQTILRRHEKDAK